MSTDARGGRRLPPRRARHRRLCLARRDGSCRERGDERNGYQMLFWRAGDLAFCAVSDTAEPELVTLEGPDHGDAAGRRAGINRAARRSSLRDTNDRGRPCRDDDRPISRRDALKCLAYGGAGTLFALSGGVLTPIDLAAAATARRGQPACRSSCRSATRTSASTRRRTRTSARRSSAAIELVNALPAAARLSCCTPATSRTCRRPAEFDTAAQLLSRACAPASCTPCPASTTSPTPPVSEYFKRFGAPRDNRGYYSFDHAGVHFVGLDQRAAASSRAASARSAPSSSPGSRPT